MRGVIFNSGMKVLKVILDWLQDSKDQRIELDNKVMFDSGCLVNSQLQLGGSEDREFKIVAGSGNNPTGGIYQITVKEGIAYDINGQSIVIKTSDTANAYLLSNATHTTFDGYTYPLTPRSTGSESVTNSGGTTLTLNALNYIWIAYLKVCDDSAYTIHKISSAKQFYKWDDGFRIDVTTISTPPSANHILLATVNTTGNPNPIDYNIATDYTSRPYGRLKPSRVGIKTSTTMADKTSSYLLNNNYFLDDHIKAIGTSTALSVTNPHGLTLTDIGSSSSQINSEHQYVFHVPGIINGILPASGITPVVSGTMSMTYVDNVLSITNLLVSEYISLNASDGKNYIISKDTIIANSGNTIVADIITITTSYVSTTGVYVYVDKNGLVSTATSLPSGAFSLFTFNTDSDTHIIAGSELDKRLYGTNSAERTMIFMNESAVSYNTNGIVSIRGVHTFATIDNSPATNQTYTVTFPKPFTDITSLTITCGCAGSSALHGSNFVVGAYGLTQNGFILSCRASQDWNQDSYAIVTPAYAYSPATSVKAHWEVKGI